MNDLNLYISNTLSRCGSDEKNTLQTYRWRVFGCGLLLLLTVLLVLAYRQAERQAESDIGNLNLVLEARLDSGLLQPLHGSLRRIAMAVQNGDFNTHGFDMAIAESLREQTPTVPTGVDFEIVDTNGALILSSKGLEVEPSFDQLRYWSILSGTVEDKLTN